MCPGPLKMLKHLHARLNNQPLEREGHMDASIAYKVRKMMKINNKSDEGNLIP